MVKDESIQLNANTTENGGNETLVSVELTDDETAILDYLLCHPDATQKKVSTDTNHPLRTSQRIMARLKERGVILREGSARYGKWKVTK